MILHYLLYVTFVVQELVDYSEQPDLLDLVDLPGGLESTEQEGQRDGLEQLGSLVLTVVLEQLDSLDQKVQAEPLA